MDTAKLRAASEALEAAASRGQLAVLHRLLEGLDAGWGVMFDVCGAAVVKAAEGGHLDVFKALLTGLQASGFHLRMLYFGIGLGIKALRAAARGGHLQIVESVLAEGIDPHRAMEEAVGHGHTGVLKVLLAAGVDPNSHEGAMATRADDLPSVKVLLEAGADPDGVPHSFCPNMRLALMLGRLKIVHALLEAGANPYCEGLIDCAASSGCKEVVQAILAAGPDRCVHEAVFSEAQGWTDTESYSSVFITSAP